MPKALFSILLCLISIGSIGQTRTSVASGSYTSTAVWDCTCVPSSSENIVIDSTHTVSLAANTSIIDVEIKNGGILNNNGRRIEIFGNYTVDGEHSGNGDIRLRGVNTTIDGNGTIGNSGNLEIRDGSKTILSTADLEKTTGGEFRIRGAFTVTNNGIFRSTRNINGNNASSTWTNASNSTLEAGSTLMSSGILNAAAAGNEVIYSKNGNQTIVTPFSSNYYHLRLTGTNIKTLGTNIGVLGNITIEGGTFNPGSQSVSLTGNYSNLGGILNEATSTFLLNGTSDQGMSALTEEAFYNLQVNKSSGNVVLGIDIVIGNTLTLSSGNIETGSFEVTLGTGILAIGSLARTNGYIDGTLGRWLTTTGTTYLFPIGSSSSYQPVNINFTNLTSGLLKFSFITNAPGNLGLPIEDGVDTVRHTFTEGYWASFVSSGLASSSFNLNLDATGFTSYTINTSTRLIRRTTSSSNWQVEGSHVSAASPVVFRNNLSSITSQFALGDTTNCLLPTPSISSISGSTSECTNSTGIVYSVTNTSGAICIWDITGGVKASGGTSNSITVNWGSVAMSGQVKVTEYNGCEYGDPVLLAVNINPLPIDNISGGQYVEQYTTGHAYSTTATTGYTYNWTITGGTQASGGSTSSITVDWGIQGTGSVAVTATNSCGTSSSVELSVKIFEYIRSVQTGNWNQTATWDCSCTPDVETNVIIEPGHTVSLTGNIMVNNIIINSTGVFNLSNRRLDAYGLLINNGSVSGSGRISKFGSNPLKGSGTWAQHTGIFRFDAGVHTVEADVVMVKTADIEVRANTIVINYGHIETTGDLSGSNASTSVWYNDTSSTLSVGLTLLNNGKLVSNAEHNTVIYSRTGSNSQNIKQSDANQYYNLTIDGDNVNSNKQVASNLEILGDLTIAASTFDAGGSYIIKLNGDWNNTGGTFNPISSSVVLAGSDQNINHTTEESFYNLQASTSGTKLLNTPVLVTNNLTIDNGVTLDVNSAQNNQLNVQGNIVNNGMINLQKATLLLDGTAAQSIDGSFNMYDVIGTNSSGITINSGVITLQNSMELTGSTAFNTNGNLTFLSNSTQTAYLKELAAGNSVNGNVTVQRYLNEDIGWYMLGSPVTGSTLADWNTEITMAGFTGSNFPNWQFGSVYSYSESGRNGSGYTSGYQGATNVTNALNPGEGWYVYLFSDPITADLTGPLQQGTIGTGSLSFTAIGATAEQGWHLVANPYASPILWSDVAKTNIQASEAYVRRSDVGGNYWAVNGDNIDTIYSGEGIWIQVGSGGGSLTFDEADKIDATDDYNAKQSPSTSPTLPLNMQLTYGANTNYIDYSVLQFGDTTNTSNFDASLGESRKIGSSVGTFPNIGSYATSDSSTVYYNNLNPDQSVTIPLKIWTQYPSNRNENYTLKFDGIEKWNQRNHCLILIDTVSNDTMKLGNGNNSYQWLMHDAISDPVLFLDHSTPIDIEFSKNTCFGSNDGSAKVIGSGNGTHDYIWTDTKGDTILAQKNHAGWSEIPILKAGNYYVTVSDNALCGDMGTEIIIEDGDLVISSFSYQNTQQAGEVSFSNTSIDALSYEWNFGDGDSSLVTSPTHVYKSNDTFEVSLIANRESCSDTSVQTIEIDDLYLSVADRTQKNNINIYLSGDQIIIEADFDQSTSLMIEVINTLGQQINEYSFSSSKKFRQSIPRPDTDGVYLIRVNSDDLSETEKVLVE